MLSHQMTTLMRSGSALRPATVAALVLCALTCPALVQAQVAEAPPPSLAPMLSDVMPSVVSINVRGHVAVETNPMLSDPFFQQFFDLPENMPTEREFRAAGSGVIVDGENGYVVTNNHVVENAEDISLRFSDGRQVDAQLVGTDPETDIAILSIQTSGLPELAWGDSDALQVGDYVVAVGNPFGLSQTVTSGIVSALGRTGLGIENYESFIQTDASINPGNSGGALVDLTGRLVGINTAIVGGSGGSVGIGFAIPSNIVRGVMDQIVSTGSVSRGQLGVAIEDLTPALAQRLGLPEEQAGVLVMSVMEGSGAAKAGLAVGDVITMLDGEPVASAAELRLRVGLERADQRVTVTIMRDGQTSDIEVTLGQAASVAAAAPPVEALVGVILKEQDDGVVVQTVEPGSRAAQAGLLPGDLVVAVDRQPVTSTRQIYDIAERDGSPLLIEVVRGQARQLVIVQ